MLCDILHTVFGLKVHPGMDSGSADAVRTRPRPPAGPAPPTCGRLCCRWLSRSSPSRTGRSGRTGRAAEARVSPAQDEQPWGEGISEPKRGAGATHLVGAGLEPGARQVKRFLRPNIPVAPKVSSIDEHTPAIPALQGEQAGDLRTQPLRGTGEVPGYGAWRGVQGAQPEAPGGHSPRLQAWSAERSPGGTEPLPRGAARDSQPVTGSAVFKQQGFCFQKQGRSTRGERHG